MTVSKIVDWGDAYQATIGGTVWFVPKAGDARVRQWVQEAIDGGMQVESPPAPTLEEKRAAAAMERSAFLVACVAAGVITEAEAEEAADGSWPATFDAFLGNMTTLMRIEAKAKWSQRGVVRRDSPLLTLVAAEKGVSDEALDAIFGIS